MSVRERSGTILSSIGSLIRRGTRRGAHEAKVRRLQWAIDRHKTEIGKAVYPLLETGALTVALPEVEEELRQIRQLHEQLREHQEQRGSTEG